MSRLSGCGVKSSRLVVYVSKKLLISQSVMPQGSSYFIIDSMSLIKSIILLLFKNLISMQMNSSTGFKKRTLLRPASGVLSKEKEFLKVFDISQTQPMLNAAIRSELASIQQEIQLLDKDKKIRQGESSLEKSYVATLKKWLRDAQITYEKEDDDGKILKQMGVDSYQAGFRKLWKLMGHLDLMVSKISELQIVQFLLYDQMFSEFGQDSQRSSAILSAISKGSYSPSSFQITQVILDRNKDIFAFCNELKRKNPNIVPASNKNQTQQLISQLKVENNKLMLMLEQMNQEREKEKENQKKKVKQHEKKAETERHKKSANLSQFSSAKDLFKELDDKYDQQIKSLTNERKKAEQDLLELKVKLSSYQTQLKIAQEQTKGNEFKSSKATSGSYEEALLQEMEKMKKGFERKISKLNEEFTSREREMRRKQTDIKNQNQKIKWEKSLLLKKFEAIPLQ